MSVARSYLCDERDFEHHCAAVSVKSLLVVWGVRIRAAMLTMALEVLRRMSCGHLVVCALRNAVVFEANS